jgi:hypothetical protein
MTGPAAPRHAFSPGAIIGPLCGDPRAVHISTGPPDCPACQAIEAAAAAATGELQLLVVLDMTGDDRTPADVCRALRTALEAGRGTGYLERVLFVDDLPAGVRILAPGERNGRA